MKDHNYGCGTLLNPNGSSLRCGDKIASPWESGERVVQLCELCRLRKRNEDLDFLLKRKLKP